MPHASGEKHYAAKLSVAKVAEIRALWNSVCPCCGMKPTLRNLAARYGVCKSAIGHVVNGDRWNNFPADPPSKAGAG